MEKECRECKAVLDLSMFTKQKEGKFGVRSKCKDCINKENYEYLKTPDGVATQIYGVQKISSKKRKVKEPSYTKDEFKQWLFSRDNFNKLYNSWKLSGYDRNLALSVNRLDDYLGYSFDNIELITWNENREQKHSDVYNGKNNKQSKAVMMIDDCGNVIETFYSIQSASRMTGVPAASICNCCQGKTYKKAGKYRWEYEKIELHN